MKVNACLQCVMKMLQKKSRVGFIVGQMQNGILVAHPVPLDDVKEVKELCDKLGAEIVRDFISRN